MVAEGKACGMCVPNGADLKWVRDVRRRRSSGWGGPEI